MNEMRHQGIDPPKYGAITLSAHAITEIRELCTNAGFIGYVTKPFNLESLRRVINEAIRLRMC